MPSTTTTLEHPTLGTLHGNAYGNVTQFLSLRYATLEHRFAAPVVADRLPSGDCTVYGPTPPQPENGITSEFPIIGAPAPGFDVTTAATRETQSDTECLNLHVTAPADASPKSKLPVVVWIHGGNFAVNSPNWPQYDLRKFVASSPKPLVGVAINYRTNFPGFLYLPGTAMPANRGLEDQVAALKWLQAHVGGFGGDPSHITIIGESAGSVSCELLMRRLGYDGGDRLGVRRAVMMSGTTGILALLPEAVHRAQFEQVCDKVGLGGQSDAEKVAALMKMPMATLYEAFAPVVAFVFRPLAVPALEGAGPFGMDAVMIGDTRHDGAVMSIMPALQSADVDKLFTAHLQLELGATQAVPLLAKYGLPASGAAGVFEALNDVLFYSPNVNIAKEQRKLGQKVLMYHFNELNTWDCLWKGQSNHTLDVAYLLGNYDAALTEKQKKVAQEFRHAIAAFVAGEEPWKVETKVFGGTGETERREDIYECFEAAGGQEKVRAAVASFLAKSPPE